MDAYERLSTAYRIPQHRPDRSVAVSKALQRATEIPMEVVETACEVGRYLLAVREKVTPAVRSDLTVGLTMAIAAAQAGLSTAKTNIEYPINHQLMEIIQAIMAKAIANLDELMGLC